jgi:dihydroorotase
MQEIILNKPFDAHMHWRQKSGLLNTVAPYSIAQFAGGLLMPNTNPKITSMKDLLWYRGEIKELLTKERNDDFLPIFTLYLSKEF